MSDGTATAALITGIFAISLFCLKYIVTCLFPGKCTGNLLVNACCKKPIQVNPIIKLQTCWEERYIKKNTETILDQKPPRGYHNNEDGHYAKRDTNNSTWIVKLTEDDVKEDASVYLYFPFEQNIPNYKHFLKCKIKYIENGKNKKPKAFIRIKRFKTTRTWDKDENGDYRRDGNGVPKFKYDKHSPPESHDVIKDYPILFDSNNIGSGEYYMNSSIGVLNANTPDAEIDVDNEQIGIYFKNSGTYIVEEVYYSDEKINIISCPGCFYSFYKLEEQNDTINDNV